MTTGEAIAILKDAVETAGAYVDSIELCGESDAATVLEAMRVVLLDVDSNIVLRDRYSTDDIG